MAMGASKMFVEGVELNRMGQNLTLARYPMHWHLVGEGKGQYIRNASIHDTYNRCVTVHGNQFVHNLAIQTKCHTSKPCVPTNLGAAGETAAANRQASGANGQQSKDVLLPSDNTVASYWIT